MQDASTRALTLLRNMYRAEHRDLYLKELEKCDLDGLSYYDKCKLRSNAGRRAKVELRRRHLVDYEICREAAVQEGYPRDSRSRVGG